MPGGEARPTAVPHDSPWLLYGPYLLPSFLLLIVGALIGFLRPLDGVAFRVSLMLLLLAQGISIFLDNALLLPFWPLPLLAACFAVSRLILFPLALTSIRVLAVFPNRSRLGAWISRWRYLLTVPFGLLAIDGLFDALAIVSGPDHRYARFGAILDRITPWEWLIVALIALNAALLIAQRVESRGRSRARLGIIEAGVLSALAGVLGVVLLWKSDAYWRFLAAPLSPFLSTTVWVLKLLAPILLLSFLPVSFAYAILARRVFGIRLIIRRGIQHLLLSRGVHVVEGLVLFLLLMESIRYGQARISGDVPAIAAIAAVVTLLVMFNLARVNRPLMRRIDRRFFRERYDARRVLLSLGKRLTSLRQQEEILSRVGESLEATLHPASLAFFLKKADSEDFTETWATGQDAAEPGRQTCLEPGQAGTPPAPYELLVALHNSEGLSGYVALAPKLSEEPFSTEDKELLVTVAAQMGMALENAELLEVARREAQQARELEIACQVQQKLFPKESPRVPGWDLAALCRPAQAIGGDYYDFFEIDAGNIAFALGDVSGKGLGPALLMASIHALIRNRLPRKADDLAGLMRELNQHLLSFSSQVMFITLFVGVLDARTGRLRYVNGGHNAPLLFTGEGKDPLRLDKGGTVVGFLPEPEFEQGEVSLGPGSLLALYSDGVTEAENQTEEMFEEARLIETLLAGRSLPASEIITKVLDAVDAFAGPCEQGDDITLIVIRRAASP